MTTAKLHIEGSNNRPAAIKHYLDLIDRRDYNSADAVMEDAYVEFGLIQPDKSDRQVSIKNMTTTLANLGLVENNDRQTLTELGEEFIEVLIYNEDVFFELFHVLYSTAFHRDPSPDRSISWSYYHISEGYKRRAPVDFKNTRQEIVEEVLDAADESNRDELTNPGSLSKRSINGYKHFIGELDPPVLSSSGEFQMRSFAGKEVVLTALDTLYRSDVLFESLKYGDRLELSDNVTHILSTITLIDEMDLTDVLEHTASMDGRVSMTSDYQMRVRLTEPVEFHDLA